MRFTAPLGRRLTRTIAHPGTARDGAAPKQKLYIKREREGEGEAELSRNSGTSGIRDAIAPADAARRLQRPPASRLACGACIFGILTHPYPLILLLLLVLCSPRAHLSGARVTVVTAGCEAARFHDGLAVCRTAMLCHHSLLLLIASPASPFLPPSASLPEAAGHLFCDAGMRAIRSSAAERLAPALGQMLAHSVARPPHRPKGLGS